MPFLAVIYYGADVDRGIISTNNGGYLHKNNFDTATS